MVLFVIGVNVSLCTSIRSITGIHQIGPITILLIIILLLGVVPFYYGRRERSQTDLFSQSKKRFPAIEQASFLKIAGLEEPKRELYEILEFIQFPDKFRRLGAKIPKGIILYGPPGTGKTLLAKSLAQEAEVEFVAVSGSEFVEKYVGMGASRVRELFERARQSPNGAIIFIDEIDSLGRKREGGENHIEKDQTLNQLLVEMDGFNSEQEIS